MGVLKIMDRNGHTTKQWDPANYPETIEARDAFNVALGEGRIAYRIDKDDKTKGGEIIRHFDDAADEIVLAIPLAGG